MPATEIKRPTLRNVTLPMGELGWPVLDVRVRWGRFQTIREITITDDKCDVGDLMRRIASGETSVTTVFASEGTVVINHQGRRCEVGEWRTVSSADLGRSPRKSSPLWDELSFSPLFSGEDCDGLDIDARDLKGIRVTVAKPNAKDREMRQHPGALVHGNPNLLGVGR